MVSSVLLLASIWSIDSKEIDEHKNRLLQYDGLSGEAFDTLKDCIRKNINTLSDEKAILEKEWLIEVNPKARVDEIIKELPSSLLSIR